MLQHILNLLSSNLDKVIGIYPRAGFTSSQWSLILAINWAADERPAQWVSENSYCWILKKTPIYSFKSITNFCGTWNCYEEAQQANVSTQGWCGQAGLDSELGGVFHPFVILWFWAWTVRGKRHCCLMLVNRNLKLVFLWACGPWLLCRWTTRQMSGWWRTWIPWTTTWPHSCTSPRINSWLSFGRMVRDPWAQIVGDFTLLEELFGFFFLYACSFLTLHFSIVNIYSIFSLI